MLENKPPWFTLSTNLTPPLCRNLWILSRRETCHPRRLYSITYFCCGLFPFSPFLLFWIFVCFCWLLAPVCVFGHAGGHFGARTRVWARERAFWRSGARLGTRAGMGALLDNTVYLLETDVFMRRLIVQILFVFLSYTMTYCGLRCSCLITKRKKFIVKSCING